MLTSPRDPLGACAGHPITPKYIKSVPVTASGSSSPTGKAAGGWPGKVAADSRNCQDVPHILCHDAALTSHASQPNQWVFIAQPDPASWCLRTGNRLFIINVQVQMMRDVHNCVRLLLSLLFLQACEVEPQQAQTQALPATTSPCCRLRWKAAGASAWLRRSALGSAAAHALWQGGAGCARRRIKDSGCHTALQEQCAMWLCIIQCGTGGGSSAGTSGADHHTTVCGSGRHRIQHTAVRHSGQPEQRSASTISGWGGCSLTRRCDHRGPHLGLGNDALVGSR